MKTLYIAGPMTGLPEFNFPAFFDAEERLREQGFLICNPATIRKHPAHYHGAQIWQYYMRHAIAMLLTCEEVALLPGWQDSKGAKLEVIIAQNLGMTTWDYRDGKLYAAGTTPPLDASGIGGGQTPAGGA
jgi:hypothetical protein